MMQYPSILGIKKTPLGNPCIAFYKYDGSNIRFEWSPKKGFNKFGSRTQMIDINHPVFGKGIELFMDTIAVELIEIIKWKHGSKFNNIQRITAFAEFFGDNSFAGSHEDHDVKQLKLFDVFLFQKGFLTPQDFVDFFKDKNWASQAIYQGNLNQEFIDKVKSNSLCGQILNEGVICKGYSKKINFLNHSGIWMTKIKTVDYINRLKQRYQDNWESFVDDAI